MDAVDRFLIWAARQPEQPAVVVGEETVSYGELEQRARRLAARLTSVPQARVLIALPQSADAYAAILGVGMAGGYHTPLNLAAPIEKLRRIARLLDPDLILASGELGEQLQSETSGAQVLDPTALGSGEGLIGRGRRHHLAYVLFTSGSTGQPKGVMVPRSALDHYVDWLETFGVGPADRVSQHPNLAFDISMTDIFGALSYGGTLHPLVAEGDRLMPARFIRRERITVWNSVPSVVGLMMQARQVTTANLESVRLFNFCGEPLLPEQLQALFAARPDVLVHNTYGPTEATIAVTCAKLTASTYAAASRASLTLGPPLPVTRLTLVGGAHDDEGEVVILGPQLADGYWQDPEKTAAAFRELEIDGAPARGYFTGDWAERHGDDLFFKERLDFQVKVRGYRIELDEVAAAIRACGWPISCVFKRGEALGAVVERSPERVFDEAALIDDLTRKIEAHAIPDVIRQIERMPRNDNDKLDRKAAAAWLEASLGSAG